MTKEKFKPGDRAPISGWYRVIHPSHDFTSEIIVAKGGLFPTCPKCQISPIYELIGVLTGAQTFA